MRAGSDGKVTFNPIANDRFAPGATLDSGSMQLLDPADGKFKQVVSVPKVGTFTVNPATGQVTFAAAPGYDGKAQISYRAADSAGQTISAMASVEVPLRRTPLSLKGAVSAKQVTAGGKVVIRVAATVTGPARAAELKLCQQIPADAIVVNTGGGKVRGSKVCWTTQSAAAGRKISHHVTVRIAPGARGRVLALRAGVEASNASPTRTRTVVRVKAARAQAGASGGVTG